MVKTQISIETLGTTVIGVKFMWRTCEPHMATKHRLCSCWCLFHNNAQTTNNTFLGVKKVTRFPK